jgi:hypothetical protein
MRRKGAEGRMSPDPAFVARNVQKVPVDRLVCGCGHDTVVDREITGRWVTQCFACHEPVEAVGPSAEAVPTPPAAPSITTGKTAALIAMIPDDLSIPAFLDRRQVPQQVRGEAA